MINLKQIRDTLSGINAVDGDTSTEHIDNAIENLNKAVEVMNTIAVRGKTDIDKLLGCMMGIEILIGGEKNGRCDNRQS